MALVTRSTDMFKEDKSEFGRLYIIKLVLVDGTEVHKIGIVNTDSMSRVTDRMMEILRGFFMQYRYSPYAELRKAIKVRIPYIVEKHVHDLLAEYRYKFDKRFTGSTECFEIDEDAVIEYLDKFKYTKLLEGKIKMDTKKYNAIRHAIKEERELGYGVCSDTEDKLLI